MVKNLFPLCLFLGLSISVQSQEKAKPVSAATSTVIATNESNAEITFDKDLHDFGSIDFAGNGSYEFKFKNTGSDPLIITSAKGSCGCTVPTYPKNVPIKPGETQVIKVTYDTKRVGNFVKTVSVYSNTKEHVKVITIKGKVNPAEIEEAFPMKGKSDNGATPFEKH